MSLPQYPSYKDSGIEWLGRLPEDWDLPPLYVRYEILLGKMLDEKQITGDHLVPYLRNVDVQWDHVNTSDLPRMDISPEEVERFTLKKGDVLVCEGGEVGRTAIWRSEIVPCGFQKAIHRLRPISPLENPRYFYYCMCFAASRQVFVAGSNPNTIPHLTAEKFRLYRFPRPPQCVQASIATFLDLEVSKIDALIEEQRRLVRLLNDKRQTVLAQVVTKGMDLDAPLKDSGIEWLGEVPAHWTMTPLKWLTDPDRPIMYGIVLPGPDVGQGIPVLKGGNVRPSRMNLDSMARTTPEIEAPYARARLKAGDLVYSIRGSIGDCEMVPIELEGSNITQDVARVAANTHTYAPWLRWALLSSPIRESLASKSLGATIRGVNIFDLKRASIPTPPWNEQRAIAEFVDDVVSRLDQLAGRAQRAIDLLLERRAALIAAAVTGQIDVRGFAVVEQ